MIFEAGNKRSAADHEILLFRRSAVEFNAVDRTAVIKVDLIAVLDFALDDLPKARSVTRGGDLTLYRSVHVGKDFFDFKTRVFDLNVRRHIGNGQREGYFSVFKRGNVQRGTHRKLFRVDRFALHQRIVNFVDRDFFGVGNEHVFSVGIFDNRFRGVPFSETDDIEFSFILNVRDILERFPSVTFHRKRIDFGQRGVFNAVRNIEFFRLRAEFNGYF